jgi:hypothetical protein
MFIQQNESPFLGAVITNFGNLLFVLRNSQDAIGAPKNQATRNRRPGLSLVFAEMRFSLHSFLTVVRFFRAILLSVSPLLIL